MGAPRHMLKRSTGSLTEEMVQQQQQQQPGLDYSLVTTSCPFTPFVIDMIMSAFASDLCRRID